MTLAEFKAWFEGFTEDMDARPTEKQWKRIKARVKEINGAAITKEVWLRDYRPYWTYTANSVPFSTYNTTAALPLSYNSASTEYKAALAAVGKAEYSETLS